MATPGTPCPSPALSACEYVSPFAFAVTYAGLGDTTRVLEWLEKGIDQRDILLAENFFDLCSILSVRIRDSPG